MADRMLLISWGEVVTGREERALEVFNDSMGYYGRLAQDGRVESFDVGLLDPNGGMEGFVILKGSAEQIAAVHEDREFHRVTADAMLIVHDVRLRTGYSGQGVADQMAIFTEAIAKVPQIA
jgi:hypothetical protein